MKHWYTLHGLIYGDQLMYTSMYLFTSIPIRSLRKHQDCYVLNDSIDLYFDEMDRFFANDFERKKKQYQILDSKLTS